MLYPQSCQRSAVQTWVASSLSCYPAARDPKLDQDLRHNPGIGQSKGAYAMGGDLDYAEGENTVEGDVENDPNPLGAVPEGKLGRTNR